MAAKESKAGHAAHTQKADNLGIVDGVQRPLKIVFLGAGSGFLEQLKAMGIDPLVVITDMWKAYHSALLDAFPEAEHQLCVFHVIQAVMKHTNKAMLAYRRGLPKKTEA